MKAIIAGIATGSLANVFFHNLWIAGVTALITGALAYIGQQVAKSVHNKFKKRNEKVISNNRGS